MRHATPFVALGVVLGALPCFCHVPIFYRTNDPLIVSAEPSTAYYVRATKSLDVSIHYFPGDEQYFSVLRPYRGGINGKRDTSGVVRVVPTSPCLLGPPTSSSHNEYNPPGKVFDEHYTATTYVYVDTLLSGHRSNVNQVCTFRVYSSDDVPFVVSVGTKENALSLMSINIPDLLIRLSAWNNNYVYGWFFLVLFIFLPIGLSIWSSYNDNVKYIFYENTTLATISIVSILTTLLQLLFQLEPFGWCRPSIGLLCILLYVFAILFFYILHRWRDRPQEWYRFTFGIILILLVFITPWFSQVTKFISFLLIFFLIFQTFISCPPADVKPKAALDSALDKQMSSFL